MRGYSPKLPLVLDHRGGYRLTSTLKEVVHQNFKMLMLTSPGERIMEPLFGVGLYNFLFEPNVPKAKMELIERISNQVGKYLPFVEIRQIDFNDPEGMNSDRSFLGIIIKYGIPSAGEVDVLRIDTNS